MNDKTDQNDQNDQADDHAPSEDTIDKPVLDGATETFEGDEDPRKGEDDPALIRDIESGKRTTNPYG